MSSSGTTSNWVKTITSPFRKAKACTFFNPNPNPNHNSTNKKTRHHHHHHHHHAAQGGEIDQNGVVMDLHGEVMACGYEDVQVMWSILDRNKSSHMMPSNTETNVVMIAATATHDDHYSWKS